MMPDPGTGLLIALLTLVVGLYGGLMGVGGGGLLVPILHLFFGVPLAEAIVFGLAASALISLSSSIQFLKRGDPHIRSVLFLVAGSVPAAVLGMTLGHHMPEAVLRRVFGLFLVWAFLDTLRVHPLEKKKGHRRFRPAGVRGGALSVIGALMGTVSGLLGIGGGVASTPLQRRVLSYPVKTAMANSALAIVPTTLMGMTTAMFYRAGEGLPLLPWGLLVWGALPVIVGGTLGGILHRRVHSRWLLFLFRLILVLVAYKMLAA